MSIVIVGDRAVGKTSTLLALANPSERQYVQVIDPNYENLSENYINPETGDTPPTRAVEQLPLLINVDLPGGQKQIRAVWMDTPGEYWENKDWQTQNPSAWRGIKETLNQNLGVILLLPPHRDMVQPSLLNSVDITTSINKDDLMTPTAWVNRLAKWLDLFNQDCSQVEHLIICLHKADLFCSNIALTGKQFQYKPGGGTPFYQFNKNVREMYFTAAEKVIHNYHSRGGKPIQFFVTSTKSRSLLELPWLYLSPYILYSSR
ncbi:MAG: hypothetical protein V7L13_07415 [Nostoc sp.]|uniref:hypothetical protein n=1 Tax=Nostoc sp. TaxID=1180 RepID=UPI002FFB2AF2